MTIVVADTSALVSLGIVADREPSPLEYLLEEYTVLTAAEVLDELETTASYEDDQGRAARAVLDRSDRIDVRESKIDSTVPLDDGENAAITLANDETAAMFLCDEFNQLGIVHASLIDTRLVTTPKLIAVFARNGLLAGDDAMALLEQMSDARSWANNSYVQRAREAFE